MRHRLQRHQNLFVIIEGLPHSHEHDVAHARGAHQAASVPHLLEDLAGGEIREQAQGSHIAKGAPHPAPHEVHPIRHPTCVETHTVFRLAPEDACRCPMTTVSTSAPSCSLTTIFAPVPSEVTLCSMTSLAQWEEVGRKLGTVGKPTVKDMKARLPDEAHPHRDAQGCAPMKSDWVEALLAWVGELNTVQEVPQ